METAPLPFEHAPFVDGWINNAIQGSPFGNSGTVVFDSQPTVHEIKCNFKPYTQNQNEAYLTVEVKDAACSGRPARRRFTTIKLDEFDFVLVECGKLSKLPNVSVRWAELLISDKPLHVLNIRMRGWDGAEWQWYGNRYEDMSAKSRAILDKFSNLAKLDMDVVIKQPKLSSFQAVNKFSNICNIVNYFKNPNWVAKPRKSKLMDSIDPKSPTSPLYNTMGPGKKRKATASPEEEPAAKKRKGSEMWGGKLEKLKKLSRDQAEEVCKACRD